MSAAFTLPRLDVPRYISPLRYPGGKAALAPWLALLLESQHDAADIEVWVEPFAGGAGAGLALLAAEAVEELWLYELNPALAAFWRHIIEDAPSLARRVEVSTPDMALWDWARHTVAAGGSPDDLGYAAFIINRCSRSGIVNGSAGVMGGQSQSGPVRLDARFNAEALAERIRNIGELATRISVTCADGIGAIEALTGSGFEREVMLFVDPPYLREGNRLYANGMSESDHQRLAAALTTSTARWVLTYDDEPAVTDTLYPQHRVLAYEIRNNANRARVAREFAVFADDVQVPAVSPVPNLGATWLPRPRLGRVNELHRA